MTVGEKVKVGHVYSTREAFIEAVESDTAVSNGVPEFGIVKDVFTTKVHEISFGCKACLRRQKEAAKAAGRDSHVTPFHRIRAYEFRGGGRHGW